MKSLLIQFHAEPGEIVEFVDTVSRELGLAVALIALNPFGVTPMTHFKCAGEVSSFAGSVDLRIAMKEGGLNLRAESPNNFLDLNPGCITLSVGRFAEEGLNESSFSFMSCDAQAICVASKVARSLKRLTKAGAVAVNPDTGAEVMIRSHRYTAGAKRKYDEGVRILPVAGKSLYKLPGTGW